VREEGAAGERRARRRGPPTLEQAKGGVVGFGAAAGRRGFERQVGSYRVDAREMIQ
jgi:hypothetical protein